jgi:hypothetical protein
MPQASFPNLLTAIQEKEKKDGEGVHREFPAQNNPLLYIYGIF